MLLQTGFQREGILDYATARPLGITENALPKKTRLRLTIVPVLKRTRPLSLEPNSPKEENPKERLSVLGLGEVPKCSQAAPSLALAELNKIFHLTRSQRFILKS